MTSTFHDSGRVAGDRARALLFHFWLLRLRLARRRVSRPFLARGGGAQLLQLGVGGPQRLAVLAVEAGGEAFGLQAEESEGKRTRDDGQAAI